LATKEVACEVSAIHRIIDTTDLGQPQAGDVVSKNQVAELTLRMKSPIAFDLSSSFEATGRFVLVDEYDIAGGGIITELVHDEQEGLRQEARQREFAWLRGDVGAEERARQYGHRPAIVLFTGAAQNGKSFLARRVESLLVADGRLAYLLDGANLLQGLDADLSAADPAFAIERIRRYGEVARLLIDAGMIVVSTSKTFGVNYQRMADMIRTLVQPAAVIAVHMSKEGEEAPPNTDLHFAGPRDFDEAARLIIEELKRRGVLGQSKDRSHIQFSI
jgi:bifunctional enzyme CysN/CysC